MKTKAIILILLGLVSCSPDRQIHNILKNEFRRGEVYRQILQNQIYTAQLLDSIRYLNQINEAMLYASTGHGSTDVLIDQVLRGTNKDSVTCRRMCSGILDSEKAMSIMMQLMIEKGYIEKECIKGSRQEKK